MADNSLSITLGGREIPVLREMISIGKLHFYTENPRVYSVVRSEGDKEPDQARIQEVLQDMEHVKTLIHSINSNGGLTDPILVREKDMAVVEGNSRLAAYRVLSSKNPVQWGKIKCDVLQGEITDNDVRALLASFHIIGKKDWDPFEQAGMFYRWSEEGDCIEEISASVESMGINSGMIKHWIDVYSLMVQENDTQPKKWSYYDELLKSNIIKGAVKKEPKLMPLIISQIKNGNIGKADDVRKKVVAVAKSGGKVVRKFVKNKNLDQAYESAVAGGAENALIGQLRKFRDVISRSDARSNVKGMNKEAMEECHFQLKKIKKKIKCLIEVIEKKKN